MTLMSMINHFRIKRTRFHFWKGFLAKAYQFSDFSSNDYGLNERARNGLLAQPLSSPLVS